MEPVQKGRPGEGAAWGLGEAGVFRLGRAEVKVAHAGEASGCLLGPCGWSSETGL